MVTILPFFSQQNKIDSRFLLECCCTTLISNFLAHALTKLTARDVTVVVPESSQISGFSPNWPCPVYPVSIPHSNFNQRANFPLEKLVPLLSQTKILISNHELLSAPIRELFPKIKIIQINHMQALGDWQWMRDRQRESWRASDYVAFLGNILRDYAVSIEPTIGPKTLVWPLIYDAAYFPETKGVNRDIDILFVQRCSKSNYTHHREFIQAIRTLHEIHWPGKVAFTDTTHWLEDFEPELVADLNVTFLHTKDRSSYTRALGRTKCAIAMLEHDLHGGIAIREAIVSGAIPLLLDTPAYRELIGPETSKNWPAFVTIEPNNISDKILQFTNTKFEQTPIYKQVRERVKQESYQQVFVNEVAPLIRRLETA